MKERRSDPDIRGDDDHGHCQRDGNTLVSSEFFLVHVRIVLHRVHRLLLLRIRGTAFFGRLRLLRQCSAFFDHGARLAEDFPVEKTKHLTEHTADISHAEEKDRYADGRVADAAQLTFP